MYLVWAEPLSLFHRDGSGVVGENGLTRTGRLSLPLACLWGPCD